MTDDSKDQIANGSRLAISGSLLGSLGAFIGASCCVLPIVLFNVGVSSAVIAQLGFFARHKDIFLYGSLGLLFMGVFIVLFQGQRPQRRVVVAFIVALTIIGIAYIFPFYESQLLRLIR